MMRFLRESLRKDLVRHAKDPLAMALWTGIPLVVGLLIVFAFGDRSDKPPRAKVLIADQDDTFVSGLLKALLAREELRILESEVVALEDGEARIARGDGSALLVIPAGFQDAVLKDEPVELALSTNPAQSVLPQLAEQMLQAFVDLAFYAQRVLGDEVREIVDELGGFDGPPSDETVARISVVANGVITRARRYLAPPALALETSVDEGEKRPNLAVLFLPGIVVMALVFLANGISEDLWRERRLGTIRRAVSAPAGVGPLFGGKVVAGMLVAAGISLVMLLLGMWYLELPLRKLPVAVVWCTLTAGVLLLGMCYLQTLASSQHGGQILANAVSFPLLMLGGSFFPSELMPGWLAAIGRYTPNGWSLEHLKDLLVDRGSSAALWIGFGVLCLVALVLFWLTLARVQKFARAG